MKAPAGTAGTTDKDSSKDSIYYREDHLLLTEAAANPAYSNTEKSNYY